MHGDALHTDLDFPFAALFGIIVVKRGEFLQILVPPIHHIVLLINVFSRHLNVFALVVKRVGADDDGNILVVNGGIGSIFQMLVGNSAVQVQDFIIPFGAAESDQTVATILDDVGEVAPAFGILIGFQGAAGNDDKLV